MRVVCVASGPSLTKKDLEYCHGKAKIYVVSDVYKIAPFADVLYSCDESWWDFHSGAFDFGGAKWTLTKSAADKYGLNFINCIYGAVWSNKPEFIASGGNSGFQALNLAVIHGATEVILLGYDMQATGGQRHFFGDHPPGLHRPSNYLGWVKNFVRAADQIPVPVINCSRETAIPCFPRRELRDVL